MPCSQQLLSAVNRNRVRRWTSLSSHLPHVQSLTTAPAPSDLVLAPTVSQFVFVCLSPSAVSPSRASQSWSNLASSCSRLFKVPLLRCAPPCTHVLVVFSVWLKSPSTCCHLAPFNYFISLLQCPYGQVSVKDPAKKKHFNSLFYI